MTAILEVGYYHLLHKVQPIESLQAPMQGEQDVAYLLKSKPGRHITAPAGINDTTSFSDPNDKMVGYVLIKPEPNTQFQLDANELENVTRISFSPTADQFRTLEYGLKEYGDKAEKIVITVDDLGLPAALFPWLHKLVPQSYMEALAQAGKGKPVLISERRCRSASNALDKRIRATNPDNNDFQAAYAHSGFLPATIENPQTHDTTDCGNGNMVLCCRAALDDKPDGKQGLVISLTRDVGEGRTVPSCGIVNAGRLKEIVKATGCDNLVTIDHTGDDPNIRYKNFDGAVVASWIEPDLSLNITNITMKGQGTGERRIVDKYSLGELRDEGGLKLDELLEELTGKMHKVTPIANGKGLTVSQSADEVRSCALPSRLR